MRNMTKWIIVSDNHNEPGILYYTAEKNSDADVLLHLGDSEFSYDDTELSLYRWVKGNCDFYQEFPKEELVEKDGVRAFYTHGHLYDVNRSRIKLAEKAKSLGCIFAFYGHTHIAKYEEIAGVHVINPGSISQSRSNIEETYAEVDVRERQQEAILNFSNREDQILDTVKMSL